MMKGSRAWTVLVAAVLVALAAVQGGSSPARYQTLVLVDSLHLVNTHSQFFAQLTQRGHELTFKPITDPTVRVTEFGVHLYHNIILLAPTAEELGPNVDERAILAFIDSGRNVLVAANEKISAAVREIAEQCGVDFDGDQDADVQPMVIDHHKFDLSDPESDHTVIAADNFIDSPIVLGSQKLRPVLYRGIGMAVNEDNPLAIKILSGSATTYSADPNSPIQGYPESAGADTQLVVAIQARNNARVTFAGSVDLFSDEFFASPVKTNSQSFDKSGNEDFCRELGKWAFGERGILRVSKVRHHLSGSRQQPDVYTVKDHVEYEAYIQEFVEGKWVPFIAKDVQLEFFRIDPFVRTALKSDQQGRYSASFQVPDVYGIFQFRINHHRLGYGNLSHAKQVTVRPYMHNQFERFIGQAFPYYASTFSMMIGFFLFGVVFLYQKGGSTPAASGSAALANAATHID